MYIIRKKIKLIRIGLVRPVAACATQASDCKGGRLWVQFQLEEIKYLIFFYFPALVTRRQSSMLSTRTEQTRHREPGKLMLRYYVPRFHVHTLLCAGCSVESKIKKVCFDDK